MSNFKRECERRSPQKNSSREAFSLLELLVVISIIGVLAGLLFPALRHAKSKAQGTVCLSNARQLMLGWLMYSDDHQGWLCPNGSAPKQGWVEGVMNFDVNFTDNTNTLYLVEPEYAKLGAYVRSPAVYHCPADKSIVSINREKHSRVRTVAMNEAVGSNAEGLSHSPGAWKVYRRQNDIIAPIPSNLWVLMEQHPDSIDDGKFSVDCGNQNGDAEWIDFPANFHNRSCSLSFADGHSEMRKWLAEESTPPNRYCGCFSHYAANMHFTGAPNSPDIAWLQVRTSARRN